MKKHIIINIISTTLFVIAGFSLAMTILTLTEWEDLFCGTMYAIVTIGYAFFGVVFQRWAQSEETYYTSKQTEVDEIYNELTRMFNKHYWALNIDKTIPHRHNKLKLTEWAADVALACQLYQEEYNTKELDPNAHQDLSIMIGLAQDLIENKKYI
jgi:hypothetical protein